MADEEKDLETDADIEDAEPVDDADVPGAQPEGGEEPKKRKGGKEKKAVRKRKSKKENENPLARAIRMAVETGKVDFGARTGEKMALTAGAKMLVIASNAPKDLAEDLDRYCKLSEIPLAKFDGTSIELGSICGKPYPISVLSVLDAGNSDILELSKKK
jgi:large subunit ribosomal protein L30e